jgi:ribosomal protein L40E
MTKGADIEKAYALIIGISEYKYPGIRRLNYTHADEDSVVFIFIAGHGGIEEVPPGIEKDNLAKYLLPFDSVLDNLYASALSNRDFNDLLLRIRSKKLVIFMDACYSGGVSERTRDVKITDDPDKKLGEGQDLGIIESELIEIPKKEKKNQEQKRLQRLMDEEERIQREKEGEKADDKIKNFCPKCGEENVNRKEFCRKCGTALVRDKMISYNKSLAVASVVGVFLLGFWLIAPGFSDQKTNSIDMEFVMIPADEFDMGSPSTEAGRWDNEGPVNHVKIASAFYMDNHEITQKQWHDVMGMGAG